MRIFFLAFACLILPAKGADFTPFFETHCVECHGTDVQKGDFRIDTVPPLDSAHNAAENWSLIADVLETGEMPPRKKPRPPTGEVEQLVEWVSAELAKISEPVPALRRMNRTEYEHTVQDLLGIDTPLAELLPEDNSVQGFDNVANGLGISSILMERYLEAANAAFEGVIRRIEPLPASTRRAVLMEQKENIASVKGNKGGVIEKDGGFVDFTPGWPPSRIDSAHPIEDGVYRCRVAVFPHDPNEHRTLSVGIFVGPLFGAGKREFMGIYDVTGTAQQPRIIEFTSRMAEGNSLHILPWVFPEHVTYRDKHEKRPGVGILWAETHGPLDQAFPSLSQQRLFGDSATLSMKEGDYYYLRHRKGVRSHFVHSEAPREDAARIIRDFVPRAFRRPVDPALVEQFVELTLERLDVGNTFEQAVRSGVAAVLCSPHFLLLNQSPEVDDYTIAARLSYFLWSSMPDEELLQLAAAGKLRDPDIRATQVDRMLADAKTERFIENFTGQWLDLHDIDFTTPDKKLYPEFDELLQRSMLAETRGFFRHLLKHNLSVTNFVDSDFVILNQRLAEHYGIPGIRGHEAFRVVPLPEDSVRGGILTHASVLKVTANGTSTSPILRGVWVLENLFGQPPLPPPSGVPAVEPDIRGSVSIRDQMNKHQESESCARCHVRIDPPGFALEEFNAIGGEREWYRSLGTVGDKVKNVSYRVGPTVESHGVWPDGREFADFAEFRHQLLQNPELIARTIARKLLIYGTGRPVTNADRATIDSILEATQPDHYGLTSMIHAVVASDLFLRP